MVLPSGRACSCTCRWERDSVTVEDVIACGEFKAALPRGERLSSGYPSCAWHRKLVSACTGADRQQSGSHLPDRSFRDVASVREGCSRQTALKPRPVWERQFLPAWIGGGCSPVITLHWRWSGIVLHVDCARWGQTPEDLRHLALNAPHARTRERALALFDITWLCSTSLSTAAPRRWPCARVGGPTR